MSLSRLATTGPHDDLQCILLKFVVALRRHRWQQRRRGGRGGRLRRARRAAASATAPRRRRIVVLQRRRRRRLGCRRRDDDARLPRVRRGLRDRGELGRGGIGGRAGGRGRQAEAAAARRRALASGRRRDGGGFAQVCLQPADQLVLRAVVAETELRADLATAARHARWRRTMRLPRHSFDMCFGTTVVSVVGVSDGVACVAPARIPRPSSRP